MIICFYTSHHTKINALIDHGFINSIRDIADWLTLEPSWIVSLSYQTLKFFYSSQSVCEQPYHTPCVCSPEIDLLELGFLCKYH